MKSAIKKVFSALALVSIGGCIAFTFIGCSTTKVEVSPDGGWSVKVDTDWLKRELQSFHAKKDGSGNVEVEFNGYKHDTSEQRAKNASEFWYGVSVLGRLAGATFNPAVASVPLGRDAANAADTATLVSATAAAKTATIKAKADAAATKAQATQTTATGTDCAGGSCTPATTK